MDKRELRYGGTFGVARIGARWYVKVTVPDDTGKLRIAMTPPLPTRAAAEAKRDELRDSYVAHMAAEGFGALVIDEPATKGRPS